jgi:hypothetical protein
LPLWDLRFSRRWLWRIPSSGMCRRVDILLTDVSEEYIASIFRGKKSTSDEPAWGGSSRLSLSLSLTQSTATRSPWFIARGFLPPEDRGSSETSVNKIPTRRHIPEDGILQACLCLWHHFSMFRCKWHVVARRQLFNISLLSWIIDPTPQNSHVWKEMYTNVCPSKKAWRLPCIVTKHWELTDRQTVVIEINDSIISNILLGSAHTAHLSSPHEIRLEEFQNYRRNSCSTFIVAPYVHISLKKEVEFLLKRPKHFSSVYVTVLGI